MCAAACSCKQSVSLCWDFFLHNCTITTTATPRVHQGGRWITLHDTSWHALISRLPLLLPPATTTTTRTLIQELNPRSKCTLSSCLLPFGFPPPLLCTGEGSFRQCPHSSHDRGSVASRVALYNWWEVCDTGHSRCGCQGWGTQSSNITLQHGTNGFNGALYKKPHAQGIYTIQSKCIQCKINRPGCVFLVHAPHLHSNPSFLTFGSLCFPLPVALRSNITTAENLV